MTKLDYHLQHSPWVIGRTVVFCCLGSLLYGYDIGCTSSAIIQLQTPLSGVSWYTRIHDTAYIRSHLTSATLIGSLISCLALTFVAPTYNAKGLLQSSSCFYIIGSLFQLWAYHLGLYTLIFSRILYGVGIGMSMVAIPSYLSDVCPTNIRGMAISLKESFIMLGLLIGYSIGYGLSNSKGGWALMYGAALPIGFIMLVGTISIPEPYRFLISKGNIREAHVSIRSIYPYMNADQASEFTQACSIPTTRSDNNVCVRLSTPKIYTSLWLCILLVAFQQFSGQPTILYYLNTLLNLMHLSSFHTIWIGGIMLIATLITPWIIEFSGRKFILGVGCTIMLICLLIIATITAVTQPDHYNADLVVSLTALCLYLVGYEIGFGPITWLISSEIAPVDSKGFVLAVTSLVNLFCNWFVCALFPITTEDYGISSLLFIYCAMLFACILFLSSSLIPETKGMSLEEIEEEMASRWQPSRYTYLDIDE